MSNLICYFGHHRSGSSYIRSILESVALATGKPAKVIHKLEDFQSSSLDTMLIATNGNKEHTDSIEFDRAFHVIRDPRDIVVSSYFSHLISHKTDVWHELISHREQLQNMSKDEGITYEIEVCRKEQLTEMKNWDYNQENILELKFEDFISDLETNWIQIFDFLEIYFTDHQPSLKSHLIHQSNKLIRKVNNKIPNYGVEQFYISQTPSHSYLTRLINENQFNQKSGRKPGQEDTNHHYRKGVSGDWQNHLTPKHKEKFKELWGDLLIQLGYEKGYDW